MDKMIHFPHLEFLDEAGQKQASDQFHPALWVWLRHFG